MANSLYKSYLIPLTSYFLVLFIIILFNAFLSYEYVLSISASVMLIVPILMGGDENVFLINSRGLLNGILASIAIVCAYLFVVYLLPLDFGNELSFERVTLSLILINFFLVALPEELFFRGYLQKELGNDVKAIVIVSILFAIAHFITICIFKGSSIFVCSINVLTFFPSLVMGYLYYKTGTIWSSIFFHFLANIVHAVVLSG